MKNPYTLPEDQRERLRRTEFYAYKMMLAHLSTAAYFKEDMKERLECIPSGVQRMRLALGALRSICDDICGTVPNAQIKALYGTMKDFELRLTPKLTPASANIIMTEQQGKDLVDAAQCRCRDCTKDGESCRACSLYKILESTVPLEDYGNGLLCPYALQQWEE